MLQHLLIVITVIFSLVLITKYKETMPLYITGLALIGAVLLHYIGQKPDATDQLPDVVEHLQISGEAVQNVGSIYNTGKMIVKDFDVTGNFNLLPKGTIVAWAGDVAPAGWALCDGKNGTPDLKGRFIMGFGAGEQLKATGGERAHTITVAEMPGHAHGLFSAADDDGYCKQGTCGVQLSDRYTNDNGKNIADLTAGNLTKILPTGGNQPHNNLPPFVVLSYIMKL